jgi:hypothetical protein
MPPSISFDLAIIDNVQRVQHFGGELRGFFEDRRNGVDGSILITELPTCSSPARSFMTNNMSFSRAW